MFSLLRLLLISFFPIVKSCSTITGLSGAELTGVCPNDTVISPVNTTVSYNCSFFRPTGVTFYWVIDSRSPPYNFNPDDPEIDINFPSGTSGVSNLTFTPHSSKNTSIQCILCPFMSSCIETELVHLVTFGKSKISFILS